MWLGERSGCVEEIRLLVPSRLGAAPSAAGSVPSLLPRRGPGGVSPCRTETVRRRGPGRACQMLCVIAERPGGAVKAPCSSSWEIPPARRGIPGRGRVALRGVREGEPGPSLGAQRSGRVRRRWASGKV